MTERPHALDRDITIRARPEIVFRYFTDSERFARWWGEGSRIEPSPGGAVRIRYPNAIVVTGEVVEIDPPRRIVFTYAYGETPGPDPTLVTIELLPHVDGTLLRLRHEFADAKTRDAHVQGWRYQLARFAAVVGDEVHAGAADAISAWFASWNEADVSRRRDALAGAVAPDVRFRDGNGDIYGIDELVPHIAATHRFMAGITLLPRGQVRRGHDVALADWQAVRQDGSVVRTGTSVFRFTPEGRIEDVTGIG